MLSTPVIFTESSLKHDHKSKIAFIGSCFSNEIGQRLIDLKFDVKVNPFGTIFNPLTIFNCTDNQYDINKNHFIINRDLCFHYDYHSSIFANNKTDLRDKIESIHLESNAFIQDADVLIFTLGTAFVHELKSTSKIINNCHKQDKKLFNKRLLRIEEITNAFDTLYSSLNPKTEIILNISPVRHTKEGLAENQLSKSILRVTCHTLTEKYKNVSYLPSYEKMIDELRDYRFYKSDLIHPSDLAVDLIFEAFCTAYFSSDCLALTREIKKINIELKHRSLYGKNEAHLLFLTHLRDKLIAFNSTIDFKAEIEFLTKELAQ